MSSEKLNLSWRDFNYCTSNTFKNLFSETDFADVTLVSDDLQQIQAHKIILSASSPILKKILRRNPQQHPIIYLTGIAYTEMYSLINFIYLGRTQVNQGNLNLFMEAANKFDVQGLKYENDYCEEPEFYKVITKMQNEDEMAHFGDDSTNTNNSEQNSKEDIDSDVVDQDFEKDSTILTKQEFKKTIEDSLYHCNECEYKSRYRNDVKRHNNAVHDKIRYPCDMCDFKSSFTHNLIQHKKTKHSQIRKIQKF